jgi:hypothetical protein
MTIDVFAGRRSTYLQFVHKFVDDFENPVGKIHSLSGVENSPISSRNHIFVCTLMKKKQAQITHRLFFCSLYLRVCSLFGSHDQMGSTVTTKTHCCYLETFSRTKKSARRQLEKKSQEKILLFERV